MLVPKSTLADNAVNRKIIQWHVYRKEQTTAKKNKLQKFVRKTRRKNKACYVGFRAKQKQRKRKMLPCPWNLIGGTAFYQGTSIKGSPRAYRYCDYQAFDWEKKIKIK